MPLAVKYDGGVPKKKPPKVLRPDPKILARTLDDIFAEQDQLSEQMRKLLDRSRELSDAVDWMKRNQYRHKWTAPFPKKAKGK